MSQQSNQVYEFGPFRLEAREHRLMRADQAIPLTGKAFATLRVLVEQHGRLVPKQDLMNAVWPGTVVEENNLDRNISILRKILGEQPDGRQFIETVPRVGYRFIASVREAAAAKAATADAAAPSTGRQEIRFCRTTDKVRLAYSTVGTGFPLV